MPQRNEPIAVIGSAFRFPGKCDTPSKLWELLKQPSDLLQEIPRSRFNASAWYHPDSAHHGTSNVTQSYFLSEDPAAFDAQFFNIPPNECEAIDPQQRMLLEVVYESLCAAGIPMESLRGSSTACYVGQMCDDWSGILMKDWETIPQYSATGISRSIMSNRISYFYDWRGPSMTIDTACSSSLVAVHEAVQTLRSGDSSVAVACGANLILSPGMYIAESKLKMLSPDGRSRMWDADANGYARGEGIAAVVLKTLSQAIKDGDDITGVIRETGFNQDGRTTGITMPSNKAQAALIRDTYAKAGLDPQNDQDRPQFFHAHGTGTPAGDPQEAEAISSTFFSGNAGSESKLYVGSIKTIIGHTEGTAGLASLISTTLALQNKTIPPNMHFQTLSEKVAPFYENLEVPTTSKPWPKVRDGQPLRASVNSFGFGGANCHAILESYEPQERNVQAELFTPLTFSANSEKILRKMLDSAAEFLSADHPSNLRDIAWTLQSRRSVLPVKIAISGRTVRDLLSSIDTARATTESFGVRSTSQNDMEILGIFTGQGAQWPTMGAALIKASPYVRQVITALDKSLQDLPVEDRPSWSIGSELEAGVHESRLAEAALSQPLCTAVQVVLVDLIKAAGIRMKAVVGHSSGEIAAAYAAGFVSAADAIRIAYYRGLYAKLATSSSGAKGAMLAVATDLQDAREFCDLEQFEGRLTVAASNAAASITLSGDEDAIDEARSIFKDESKFARKLRVDTAYHSFHMDPCSQPYLDAMDRCGVKIGEGSTTTAWYSSVHLNTKMSKEIINNQYWVDNMKNPVLFSQAIATAVQSAGPYDLALELGPHPSLKGPSLETIEEATGSSSTAYTGLLSRGVDDVSAFSAALGYLWQIGLRIDLDAYDEIVSGVSRSDRKVAVNLPAYPWDHDTKYWTESRISASYKNRDVGPHPVLGVTVDEGTTGQQFQWRNILFPREISWMSGHKLQGQIVFPASGYASMAIEAIMTRAVKPVQLIEITDFVIGRAISFLDESVGIESSVTLGLTASTSDLVTANFEVSSCPRGDHNMNLNASGTISIRFGEPANDTLFANPAVQFNMVDVDTDRFYKTLTDMGYNYAPPFKAISSIRRRTDTAVGDMTDVRGENWEDNLLVHPGIIDTSFQTVFAAFSSPGDERLWALHVPTNIKRLSINPALCVFPPGEQTVWPWQSCVTSDPQSSLTADIEVFANGTDVLMEVEGIKLVPLSQSTEDDDCQLFSNFVYDLANPDGILASPNRPTEFDVQLAKDSERFSFYWITQLLNSVTPEDEEQTLTHYKRMLKWCRFVSMQVENSEHPYVGPEAKEDTLDFVESLVQPYGDRSDVGLIRAVGQNLAHVIKSRGNIVEYMVKDGMLDAFYEEGLGLHIANHWEANMAAQIAHRYPRMNILEIGGGTGGSTRMILPKLGKAFSSYKFSDISAGFFDSAEERFKEYADRMSFSTFDMEKDITEQGFVDGHYDMILASNVLHAGPDLDLIMKNVRRLLKPGGHLINMEATTYFPSLRNGFAMAGLPGWWCGADTGRPWGPTISVDAWDELYKRTGFSGVDTYPPHLNDLHHFTVMATQAVDDRIALLRAPLSVEPAEAKQQPLVIIGGGSDETADVVEQMRVFLNPHFDSILSVESVEAFADLSLEDSPVVVNLSELDGSIMQDLMDDQPNKHEALKYLFGRASDILWITQNNRWERPYSRMLVGMARTFRKEYPGLRFQALDVDVVDSQSAQNFAESLIRHQKLLDWSEELAPGTIHWSEEPELHLQDGRFYVPRLKPVEDMNDRYNSYKRQITHTVNPSVSKVELVAREGSYALEQPSPLRLPHQIENGVTLRVAKSLLQSIKVPGTGHYFLCCGTNATGESLLALSGSAESVIEVPALWTIPHTSKIDSAQVLLSVSANLVANVVITEAPANSTLLAHEPDPAVAAALIKQGVTKRIRVVCTTFQEGRKGPHWIYIHPTAPHRLVKKKLPRNVSTFVNFAGKHEQFISDISKELPFGCTVSDLSTFFTGSGNSPAANSELVAQYFTKGWSIAKATNFSIPGSRPTLPLREVPNWTLSGELRVVNWETDEQVTVNTQPVDADDILFKADKTYLMIGLSGEVGQSITQWMVRHGARYIVLTSRNPQVSSDWIDFLEDEYGATIRAMPLDITDRDALHACYNRICRTMPPIVGVAHGAMVLVDSLFQNMSYEDLMTVLKPKVLGAIHLDELFSEDTLDFFILFSSITGVVGNVGQSNYVGSNFFLEALGLQRKRRGLVASVIGISSLVGIGYVERSENFDAEHFARLGYRNVSEQDVQMLFGEAILRGRADSTGSHEIITGVVPRFPNSDGMAAYLQDVKFGHLILQRATEKQDGNTSLQVPVRIQLQTALTEDEVREIMDIGFTKRIKKILRVPDETEFSATSSLVEQGVDSLVAVEIRSWFLKEVDVDIPVLKVLGGASINDLLNEALQRLVPEMVPQLDSKPTPEPVTHPIPPQPDLLVSSPSPAHNVASLNGYFSTELKSGLTGKPIETHTHAVELREVQEGPSKEEIDEARRLARELTKQKEEERIFEDLRRSEVTERMSFGQSRFWFLNQALKDKTTFNMAIMVRLEGRIRIKDLEKAVQAVTLRHEALRTRYFATGAFMENPMQGITPSSRVKLASQRIKKESEAYAELDKFRSHVWDLGRWDGLKVSLLSLSDVVHFFIIGCHHISMDGFGFNVFFSDLEKAYKGAKLPVLPESSQYRAFARRQHQDWECGRVKPDLAFYRDMIPHDVKPLPLFPFARTNTRLPLDSYGSHKVEFRIDPTLTSKIKTISRKLNCTPFHFYLTTLQILVFRLLDCEDFFIGIADANRIDDQFMSTLGFLLNLVPLRFERNATTSFGTALQQSRNKVYGGLAHSRLPYNVLLEQLEIPRSAAHTPLFQIFVDYRQGVQERQSYMGLKAEGEKWHIANTGYDLTLDILESNGGSRLELGLQKQLYTVESASLLMDAFVNLLTSFAEQPDVDWNVPDLWSKELISKALITGRGKAIDYSWGPTVVHRINRMIGEHSSEIALKDGSGQMTYSDMDGRINSICSAILQAKTTIGDRVAVFQRPSSDWVCSLLAIFRAGAVYVPLDLRTPTSRLAAIVKEAEPHLILADSQTFNEAKALGVSEAHIVNVSALPATDETPKENLAQAGAPAVILFTSGSTGTPKGIHINHTNIINQLEGFSEQTNIEAFGSRVLQQSAYSFDKSLQQIFLALVHGGALYIAPLEKRGDPQALVELMVSEKITHTTATPSEYLMWFRYAKESLTKCTSWMAALLGGEPATEHLLDEFRRLDLPREVRVINSYGPAEITMSCAKANIPYATMLPGEPIMAGFMLPNYSAYIVDEKFRPVPLGIPGEIIIAGVGVGDGYLKNRELTKLKFLPDVFGGSGMMYRTGDRGRLDERGALHCDGRLEGDTQVKLRGVRMELEDIENSILQAANGALEKAVVTLRGEQEDAFLAAHVVFSPTHAIGDFSILLERLPTLLQLPQYMIPAVFAQLDRLPLTAHLKVDRKAVRALPIIENEAIAEDDDNLSSTESKLAAVWRQVISSAPVLKSKANFFYVGGDSLKIVKLSMLLRDTFNVNLGLMEIMNAATLANMAHLIDDALRVEQIDWQTETSLPGSATRNGQIVIRKTPMKQHDLVVMITGATGVLGRKIIAHLATEPRVSKIYAIVRPQGGSAAERITDTTGKVLVKPGDLDLPLLGLSIPEAAAISAEADVILHLGANRSFWDSYYELRSTNVSSIKEIISIANARKTPIHFVSSGSVANYATMPPPVDGSDGYVASKWAAEALITNAAEQLGLPCVFHRPTKTQGISQAPPEILDELVALTKKIQKRPVLDGLSGSIGLVPADTIAGNISDALFDEALLRPGEASVVAQPSAINVDIGALADRLKLDEEIMGMEVVPALKWMGIAKKMGWSQFMVGQELVMSKEGEHVVNKR